MTERPLSAQQASERAVRVVAEPFGNENTMHYGLAWGFWWWWIVVLFFIWLIFLPPFGWGSRWASSYRGNTSMYPPQPVALDPEWKSAESHFIESPSEGVADANRIVTRLVDVKQNGPGLEGYRVGHEVAQQAQRGQANDRDLRAAMRAFRLLHARYSM